MSTLTVNNLYIGSNQGFTTMGDVIGTSLSTILLYTGVEYATNIYASSLSVSSIQATQLTTAGTVTFASNSLFTGGITSYLSNSGLFSNAATATFASNVLHTGGITSYLSNSGLFSNAATATFASNVLLTGGTTSYLSNSGLFSNAATATFASNVLLTGATSYLSNSGIFSNVGAATFNSNITIQQNITAIATPSTANSYSLLTLNIPTAGAATTLAPFISLVGGYGASIAGGITQSVGPVLSLGTIAGSGQPTVEGYRMTGTNSVFYGNVTVGTPAAANAITIQNGTITVPTGAGGLGNNAYLSLNTVNNCLYLGGDYVAVQPVGNITFYRDFYTSWPATFSSTVNTAKLNTTFNGTLNNGTFLVSNNASSNNYVIKADMTGATFIVRQAVNTGNVAVIENTGGGALLINPLGATVGIGSSNASYMLDVAGIARSGIPISSLTGTYATFSNLSYGIYYYITNSAFSNIALTGTTAPAGTGTAAAPSIGTGWYVTLRNNTGSYLSITVSGTLSSTPASPFTIPPSNATTIAYDAALAGGAGYVFF